MIFIEQYEKGKNIKEKLSNIIKNKYEDFTIYIIKDRKVAKRKLNKILKTTKETCCILESKLENSDIEKILIKNNIEILDGKKLFVKLLDDVILNYICRNQKRKMNTAKITIFTNENIIRNTKLIENLSKQVKELIVYTNRVEEFSRIEEKLLKKYGINITITNNRNIISKSEIYINLDFIKEEFEKIELNPKSIFINVFYKFIYDNRKFDGINIIDYEIKFPIENAKIKEKLYKYDNKKIVEYFFYYKKEIKFKNLKINYLIGKNGKVMSKELYRVFLENRKNGRK